MLCSTEWSKLFHRSHFISCHTPLSLPPDIAEDLARRPRLNLTKRTVKDPVNQLASDVQRSSIFGSGKPREEAKKEAPDN